MDCLKTVYANTCGLMHRSGMLYYEQALNVNSSATAINPNNVFNNWSALPSFNSTMFFSQGLPPSLPPTIRSPSLTLGQNYKEFQIWTNVTPSE